MILINLSSNISSFLIDTFCQSSTLLKAFTLHKDCVNSINYSIFDNFQLICFVSDDKTVLVCYVETTSKFNHSIDIQIIRFLDIRSNKKELYVIKGDKKENNGIIFFIFLSLRKKVKNSQQKSNDDCNTHLYYGSFEGFFVLNEFVVFPFYSFIQNWSIVNFLNKDKQLTDKETRNRKVKEDSEGC
ncbi:hypothetical protein RFI_07104 [Reticulomyxa filosa]|uniref:Uncharacterized protein n=1 Tax=Reticulomyxa filosa TaxID=46433 RepID=X6NVU5_RETFI|nr:hypothetical protein RFI_07104 [Reticulomyxa filosa]|eukprot:ETO30013.1 hypothetical protein RFI_07104 [Reticulomyxa filosa]